MKNRTRKISFACIFFLLTFGVSFGQSFNQGDIVFGANIGVPHLYKGIIKLATKTQAFKNQFDGSFEVSPIKGLNPICIKTEFGISEYFGLGLNYSFWNVSFNVTDKYNVLRAGAVTGTDEVDTYKFKIRSASLGIRPNLHIPFENKMNDLYIGVGLGFTSNSVQIDFSSTDVQKVKKNTAYNLRLPGTIYFAPTLGYRHYFNYYFGTNFEIGYEKGAILQAGLVFKFNVNDTKKEKKD